MDNKVFTFEFLQRISDQIARTLLKGRPDLEEARIAYMVRPGIDYPCVQWGIWKAGGIAVPLCELHPKENLIYYLKQSSADVLIYSEEYFEMVKELTASITIPFYEVQTLKVDGEFTKLPIIGINRRAMMLYTSGTTNLPKGVVTTHANISAQVNTLIDAWQWTKNDRILNVLPLHHVHGIINVMSCALAVGAQVSFLPKFSAAKIWEIICEDCITVFMAVPTIYFKLIQYWEQQDSIEQEKMSIHSSKLRLMVSGSAALPVSTLEKWKAITSHTLLERYGMTEIGMALSNSYEKERIPGHVGKPLPDVEIQLVENGEVKSNGPGEIQIKGPTVFKEYWNNPEATQSSFKDGWFLTGDRAVVNNGYYKILGRNSIDIIKSGGYKISALEIEEALRSHPDINDCGVIGIPDEEWGERIGAALVAEVLPEIEELKRFLLKKLAPYQVPKTFILIHDLPKNTMGKVTKKALLPFFNR